MDADSPTDVRLTDTQLGILAALCRPISGGNHFATPATNQEIADEVFLSVDAVKGHLRTLYRKFGIEDLPHNQKRARLVELAIGGGYIESVAPETAPGAESEADAEQASGAATVPPPGPGSGAESRAGAPAPSDPGSDAEPRTDAPAPSAPGPDAELGTGAPAPSDPGPDAELQAGAPAPTEAGPDAEPRTAPPTAAHERGRGSPDTSSRRKSAPRPGRRLAVGVGGVLVVAAIVVAVLALAGAFSSGSTDAGAPTPAAFRAKVAGYCKLALAGAPSPEGGNRVERARGYLEVIETMRGRFRSLTPPAGENLALQRFGTGLTNAAEYTSDIAESPPPAGSKAEAKAVAELTFAAGQVQAGAVGYGLGHDCSEIGDLVARSAENAAAP